MSKSLDSLIFFGTEDFSAAALSALIKDGRQIDAVITKPDMRAGRGLRLSQPKVKKLAQEAGIKVLQPEKLSEINAQLSGHKWAVLSAYGQIVPSSVLEIFGGGIINIHPSLLPAYRGPSPIEAAIINGDKTTGVSLMKLVTEMDAGPVYAQTKLPLKGNETRLELYKRLADLGAQLLIDNLDNVLSGNLQPTPQDEAKASYTKLITKADGQVDWQKPAAQIERQVRAYQDWPKSTAKLKHFDVILTRVRLAQDAADGELVQPCGQGWLEIQELVVPGGKTMSGADFIRGYLKN